MLVGTPDDTAIGSNEEITETHVKMPEHQESQNGVLQTSQNSSTLVSCQGVWVSSACHLLEGGPYKDLLIWQGMYRLCHMLYMSDYCYGWGNRKEQTYTQPE